MRLSEPNRTQIMVSHEGQILANVGSCGVEIAGDLARCYADGAINALIRLEGSEAAARFAFALSDRAVGGLREETPIFPLPVIADQTALPQIHEPTQDSVLAVAAALRGESDDDDDDGRQSGTVVVVRSGLPTWFIYWAMTLGIFAGWIIGRGWPA